VPAGCPRRTSSSRSYRCKTARRRISGGLPVRVEEHLTQICPQPLALQRQISDFVRGVDDPQPAIELQGVDDDRRVDEADVFRAQIAVPSTT
jgi:hypothetical protein